METVRHVIAAVERGSAAQRHGLCAGDAVISIGGEPVLDEIDYQALTAESRFEMEIERENGTSERILVRKAEGEPMGLRFGQSMTLSPRTCRNRCVFCFIDQMPKGLRETLYVKDDDWRYSLMMGNFVTLTNVDDAEFERIIRRKASPLYISVHTTEPELRCLMMNNRFAGDVMARLRRLGEAGIRFHCQIVVCPGYNDGEALLHTLEDLRSLWPAALSIAMVPVGLTKCREELAKVQPFSAQGAKELLAQIEPFQERCLKELGTTFAFPADEFFCLADQPIPQEAWYEGYPQIENGVGLLRQLESEMEEAADFDDDPGEAPSQTLLIATGMSAAPHIRRLCGRFAPKGTKVKVKAIENRFFGKTVTVAGLLTGGDILHQLTQEDVSGADKLLLCACMLRHEGDRFLDDMTLEEFKAGAPLPVEIIGTDGQALYDALRAR